MENEDKKTKKKKKMPSAPIKPKVSNVGGKMGEVVGGVKPELIDPKYPGSNSQIITGILGGKVQ